MRPPRHARSTRGQSANLLRLPWPPARPARYRLVCRALRVSEPSCGSASSAGGIGFRKVCAARKTVEAAFVDNQFHPMLSQSEIALLSPSSIMNFTQLCWHRGQVAWLLVAIASIRMRPVGNRSCDRMCRSARSNGTRMASMGAVSSVVCWFGKGCPP